jgi:hypothetical protein
LHALTIWSTRPSIEPNLIVSPSNILSDACNAKPLTIAIAISLLAIDTRIVPALPTAKNDVRMNCQPGSELFKQETQDVLFAIDRAVRRHNVQFAVVKDV